jgi:hypothetical protein
MMAQKEDLEAISARLLKTMYEMKAFEHSDLAKKTQECKVLSKKLVQLKRTAKMMLAASASCPHVFDEIAKVKLELAEKKKEMQELNDLDQAKFDESLKQFDSLTTMDAKTTSHPKPNAFGTFGR